MKEKNKIVFASEEVLFVLRDKEKLRRWIRVCLKDYKKKPGNINYIFCTDRYLLKINKEYLRHRTLTDIITFDYSEGDAVEGEVYISVERVKENAKLFSVTFKDELHRVMIHGILHLCGHKDKTPRTKKEMTAKEDYYLSLRSF